MLPREQQVQQVVAALQAEFPRFAPATVERRVRAGFERYAEAPVQDFLPILVQRELSALFREAEALGAVGEPARGQPAHGEPARR